MSEIRTGQKVKLFLTTAEDSKLEFDCTLKHVFEDRLALNYPEELLDYIDYLQEGDEIFVKIFTPVGVKGFDAMVLDTPLEDDFVIEYVENTSQVQRREFVRVFWTMKVFIERQGHDNVIAYSIDVSGGGLRFRCEDEFPEKENVSITMFMPDGRLVKAKGQVIPNNYIPKDEHILSFTEIDEKERDRIIKKCFELQLIKDEE